MIWKRKLSSHFQSALVYAAQLHNWQLRKGTNIPYIAHLLAVTAIVLENGGDEEMAIAALLHDAVEDQGGRKTLDEIRRRYGDRVAKLVEGCTDSITYPKPPWQARKQAYLEHLRQAPADVRLISLADKLHNARSILFDLRQDGDAIWERFNGGKSGSLWYYRSLLDVFKELEPGALVDEFERVVNEIHTLA
jgi:(p)ppGpp synthase/HD superfamily hydrolase